MTLPQDAAAPAPAQASLRVAVAGAGGRMGRMLIEAILDSSDCTLVGALDVPASPEIGADAAAFLGRSSGVRITADLAEGLRQAQVLIDFTRPEGTLAHLEACRAGSVAAVVGTTGFTPAQRSQLAGHAAALALVLAPNMSVGVHVVMRLLAQAAAALSKGYDIEIIEAHHRHKVDAPSGTALQMGQVVARAQGRSLDDAAVPARQGVTGARPAGAIGFSAIRGGDIVGDHTVLFAGTGERIEITHRSTSRQAYAQGALRAARFAARRAAEGRPGLYDMDDVLGPG